MKYLEGSSFTVRVGGSAYAEGWDRIFGKPPTPASEAAGEREVGPDCRACGQEMDPEQEVLGKHAEGDGWMCLNGDCAGSPGVAASPAPIFLGVTAGCFDCEYVHAAEQKCYCMCHAHTWTLGSK